MNKKAKTALLLFSLSFSIHAQQAVTKNSAAANEISNPPKTINIPRERIINIPSLKSRDTMFDEYSYIIQDNLKLISEGKEPDLIFFKHTIDENDYTLLEGRSAQILAVASRCNISYDTIASLNRLENSTTKLMGKTLILPTVSGLFIHKNKSENSLEILLRENYREENLTNQNLCYTINGEDFIFLPNARFTPTERAYFLDSALRLPLDKESFWISSDFGKRKNPVSGEWKEHKGIDLAAVEGTPVYAIKDGDVSFCIDNDSTFGNYIILSHDKGSMTSIYAHLSKIAVHKYDSVKKGDIIGYVGHTGMATGDHLHFEIRQGGVPQDPQKKLKLN